MASAPLNTQQPSGFMSLPVELRIPIYELCLFHDRQNGVCATVALLQTCSQVYNEAIEILGKQRYFMRVTASMSRDGTWPEMHVEGDFQDRRASSDLRIFFFPTALLQMGTFILVLNISIDKWVRSLEPYHALHRVLYSLVCHLANHPGEQMKAFTVTIESDRLLTMAERRMLYPLAKLDPRRWRVDIHGSVVQDIQAYLESNQNMMPPNLVMDDYFKVFCSLRKRVLELPQAYLGVVDQRYYANLWDDRIWINPSIEMWVLSILTSILIEATQVMEGQLRFRRFRRKWFNYRLHGWEATRKEYRHLWATSGHFDNA